jgi:enoyl-[acyl-carrier protein] reductase II
MVLPAKFGVLSFALFSACQRIVKRKAFLCSMKSIETAITRLFNIKHPIIQAGMIWCSGWELASAVSNAGGLGLIGAGSMYPDVLRDHIRKCRAATDKPFGVNVPLLYPNIEEHMAIIQEEGVPIVFTSAGNPKAWTSTLKQAGITVVHVVSNVKFALKAVEAGVDAVVAEGFEAGGHNGREETTTLCLLPLVRKNIQIPLIAAGGIGSGEAILAAMALGADAVQIGSLFIATPESSAHPSFKSAIINAGEGDTQLRLKAITPVRLLKNHFADEVAKAEGEGADVDQLKALLGRGRAKAGMFEGNMTDGELEVGQIAAAIENLTPAAQLVDQLMNDFFIAHDRISRLAVTQ